MLLILRCPLKELERKKIVFILLYILMFLKMYILSELRHVFYLSSFSLVKVFVRLLTLMLSACVLLYLLNSHFVHLYCKHNIE